MTTIAGVKVWHEPIVKADRELRHDREVAAIAVHRIQEALLKLMENRKYNDSKFHVVLTLEK